MTTTTPTLSSLFNLTSQAALVTGGGKGIGRAIALRLAEAGAHVAVVDVDDKAAQETVALVRAADGRAIAIHADVQHVAEAARAVEQAAAVTGHLNIVVNNAGIFPMSPALSTTEQLWDHVLDVNLKGAFFLAQAAARRMVEDKIAGSIINVASIDALHPSGNLVHYDASKGGMLMMTKSLAAELGKSRIRVNAVCPGGIKTPGADDIMKSAGAGAGISAEVMNAAFLQRIPLGRMGQPDDIATAVLFLASQAASYMTGSVMVVDGGYLQA
jgi:2-deoxy-D-gluconate 3-dehydrogenase